MNISVNRGLQWCGRYFSRTNIRLFGRLEIETCSMCNRLCQTCIRNSHPNRDAVKDWFSPHYMPTDVVERILRDARDIGFKGTVVLQHYDEPLMDERIEQFGEYARNLGVFSGIEICTNGDYLTEERARSLDGVFSLIVIAHYMDEPKKTELERWVRSLFKKTSLMFTQGEHIPTHFSPSFDVRALAKAYSKRPCFHPTERMILNHRGDMLLCCEDVVGNYELGNIKTSSLQDLWYGEKHRKIIRTLQQKGGRMCYGYCATCPRP